MLLTSLPLGLAALILCLFCLIARILKRSSTWLGNLAFFTLFWSLFLLIILWILPLDISGGISLVWSRQLIPFHNLFGDWLQIRSFMKQWILSFAALAAFGFCLPFLMKKQTMGAVTARALLFVLPVELLGGLCYCLGKTTAFIDFGVLLLQLPGVALGYWFFTVLRELPFIQKAMPNRRELD